MKHNAIAKNAPILIMIGSLMVLPGCGMLDWIKDKLGSKPGSAQRDAGQDGSAVLVTINGQPLITKGMLEVEKKKLLDANPQLQAMIALMDEKQLDRNLMEGLTSREIIRKYVKDHSIEQSEKYKKDYDMVLGQVKDALNTRYFMEALSVEVADAEIEKFYNENKDAMPNLLTSRGGIRAAGASFSNEQAAKDFAAKVKAAKNNINKAAKDSGLAADKVKDFKLVNDQSLGIDNELKSKITAMKSFPRVETFKVGKEYWVVAATKKEDSQYRPLEQVKAEIKQAIEKDKTMKRFEEEVASLKGEYKIQVNEDFFSQRMEDNAQSVQAEAQEQAGSVAVAQAQDAQAPVALEAKDAPVAAPQAA